MVHDIDFIISLLNKLSSTEKKSSKRELDEDEPAASTSNTNKRGSKWSELYTTVRGKANKLGLKGEKWESGIKRGVANQVS